MASMNTSSAIQVPLSVAPMMDRSDRHFRYLLRQISKHTLLYTEMIPVGALVHGHRERFLEYHPSEHPLVLQVGGYSIEDLAQCAQLAQQWSYDAININVGCPSDRVKEGRFGAALMAEPQHVADAVEAMQAKADIPVTVKHRIGIDHHDSYDFLAEFVGTVATSGCKHFSVHARIAWLDGLSPKDNRTIPPLRYEDVYRLKREFPDLFIEINGGIKTLEQAQAHLQHVDGVMIGRAVYDNPFVLSQADHLFFNQKVKPPERLAVVEKMVDHAQTHIEQGGRLHSVTRHLLQIFSGQPGARAWRRFLSERCREPDAGAHILLDAARQMQEAGFIQN
jgi:tRNA-dihydrouridine synthase A